MRFKLWFEQEEQNQLSVTNLERWISSDDLGSIKKSVDKLNAIAQKLDMKPILLTIKDRKKPQWDDNRLKAYVQSYGREPEDILVNLTGEVPRVGHHEFVATIEPKSDEDGKVINVLRTAPGQDVPEKFRKDFQGHCDHCCTARYRKQTYLLRDKRDKTYKVVGGNCLADFLRKDDLNSHIRWMKLLHDIETGEPDDDTPNYKRFDAFPTKEFIKASMASINLFGFKKSTIEYQGQIMPNYQATKEYVRYAFGIYDTLPAGLKETGIKIGGQIREEMKNVNDEDVEKVLQWIKQEQAKEGASTYIHNLYALSIQKFITGKDSGMLASLPQAYNNANQKIAKEKEKVEEKYAVPEWKDGDTISFIGKIKFRGTYEGDYGTFTILTFHTDEGYYIKWFTRTFDAEKGDVIRVEKAKVKQVENDSYLNKIVTTIKATTATHAYEYDPSVHTKELDDIKNELPKLLKKDKNFQKNKNDLIIAFQSPPLINKETTDKIIEKIENSIEDLNEKYDNETDFEKKKNYYADLQKYYVYKDWVTLKYSSGDKKAHNFIHNLNIGYLEFDDFPKEIFGIKLVYDVRELYNFVVREYKKQNNMEYHNLDYKIDDPLIKKYIHSLDVEKDYSTHYQNSEEFANAANNTIDPALKKQRLEQLIQRIKNDIHTNQTGYNSDKSYMKKRIEEDQEKLRKFTKQLEDMESL